MNDVLISENKLKELADGCISEIREAMETTRTNASGETSRGLFSEVSDNYLMLAANRKGFFNVEAGQIAGKRPNNFKEIIKKWIVDKGLNVKPMPYSPKYKGNKGVFKFASAEERGLDYAAGAIAWKNKTEGSSLYRSGGRNDVFSPAVENLVNKVRQEIGREYLKQIQFIFANSSLAKK